MALTIEIDHARTRAKAAAAGQSVVPQSVKGRIRRIKWFVLLLTLSLYYVTPFLRWDRGPNAPDQALLLDFVHGRLYFFFVEIWPQDCGKAKGCELLEDMGPRVLESLRTYLNAIPERWNTNQVVREAGK